MNVSSLVSSIFPIGAIGLTTYISKYHGLENGKVEGLIYYFIRLNFIVIIIGVILTLPFIDKISFLLFNNNNFDLYLFILLCTIPLSLIFSFTELYLKGIRRINIYVLLTSLISIISLIVFIPAVLLYNFEGALISIIILPALNSLISVGLLRKIKLFPNFRNRIPVSPELKKDILKIGFSSMFILAITNLIYLFIRTQVILNLGDEQAGIYQAVYSVSNNYFSIIFSIMGVYSIPRLAEISDVKIINIEINNTLKFMLIIFTPMIILFYIFRIYFISILYSNAFISAENLLFYQLIGDFFRVLSWVFGLWLLPALKIKEWFLFDLIFYILFLSIFSILFYFYQKNILMISIAYLISYFLHFLINIFYIIKKLKFKFDKNNLQILIISFLLIILSFFISRYYLSTGYYIIPFLLIIWSVTVFSKNDMITISNIIKSKINK